MKKFLALLLLTTALATPSLALARDVTLSGEMSTYGGPEAYLAVYLAKPDGSYESTLYVAGHKQKYYRDLTGWARLAAQDANLSLDGITGASVGAGRSFSIALSLSDALIDAGYTIHIDSAVEDQGASADDVVIPLEAVQSGVDQPGAVFVQTARITM